MSALRPRLKWLVGILASMLLLTGCDFDVYSLPLPGGADTGDRPKTVYVQFEDVLDLVPKSAVKVNDVTIGQVKDVKLDGDRARVSLEIRRDVDLPDNATATIRQTSLLGEKFVSLAAPADPSSTPLPDKATIPLARTGKNPEVEEVLGALSLVLNGGGVAQLKTIANELNLALEGREDSARSVLTQVESLVSQLDGRKADIVHAIESVNRLAVAARSQQKSIDAALEELPSALDSLDSQREDLVRMLEGLDKLGNVGVRVIKATKTSTIDSLKALVPVLTELRKAGTDFVDGFSTFLTFPFVDEAVGRDPQVARNLHMGDYVNLSVDLQLDLGHLNLPDLACVPISALPDLPIKQLVDIKLLCDGATKVLQGCLKSPPDLAACSQLPSHLADELCKAVPLLCGLKLGLASKARASAAKKGTAPVTELLDGVLKGGGLGRPAPGMSGDEKDLWKQFDQTYDTDLVELYAGPVLASGEGRRAQ